MVTDTLAQAVWAVPRMTRDIDAVVEVGPAEAGALDDFHTPSASVPLSYRDLLAVALPQAADKSRIRVPRGPTLRRSSHAARFRSFACFSSSAGAGTKPSCCSPAALNPLTTR